MTVTAHLLAPCGTIPNHPRWPLLVYQDVFDGVVGAYPEGSQPDTCTPKSFSGSTIQSVPLPPCDPVYGASGPLFEHWK